MSKIIKQKFKIIGMHCSSCAMNIDFDLEELPGLVYVRTNYAKQESEVQYDESKLTSKQIIDQISKTGYQAKLDDDTK